jgi:hypothetical protein
MHKNSESTFKIEALFIKCFRKQQETIREHYYA